jgi:ATP synthase protein I
VENKDRDQLYAAMGMVGNMGLSMVAAVAVGLFLGRLCDEWLAIYPWGAVSGIVLGMITGMWAIYKRAMEKQE